ncbi:MAG: hypothetical protein ABIW82_11710 [Dokdonella sp.]
MNKGEFVTAALVQPLESDQVMTLTGTPDDWVCTWVENGQPMTRHFQPEQLKLVSSAGARQEK